MVLAPLRPAFLAPSTQAKGIQQSSGTWAGLFKGGNITLFCRAQQHRIKRSKWQNPVMNEKSAFNLNKSKLIVKITPLKLSSYYSTVVRVTKEEFKCKVCLIKRRDASFKVPSLLWGSYWKHLSSPSIEVSRFITPQSLGQEHLLC